MRTKCKICDKGRATVRRVKITRWSTGRKPDWISFIVYLCTPCETNAKKFVRSIGLDVKFKTIKEDEF